MVNIELNLCSAHEVVPCVGSVEVTKTGRNKNGNLIGSNKINHRYFCFGYLCSVLFKTTVTAVKRGRDMRFPCPHVPN